MRRRHWHLHPLGTPASPAHPAALSLLLAAVLLIAGCQAPRLFGGPVDTRPNVLFVLTDDMRFDSLFALPAFGRLAERGTTFNRFFVTTPLCCPSRATMLNGLYARNHGVLGNRPPVGGVQAFDDRSTLATWVQATGARTGLVGRYLNGYESLDIPPGWDYWFAIWQASEDYSNYYDYRVNDNGARRYFGSRPEMYSTRVLAEQAQKFLTQETNRPFMLMVATRAPHGTATADALDSGTYKDLDFPLPTSYNEQDVDDKPSPIKRLRPLRRETQDELEVQRRRQFDSLLGVDRLISSLVEQLRKDGRLDRTWIIFSSDNGLSLGEHRRDGRKSCPYEECVRVPLVVIPPPGVASPRSEDRLVANLDLAPTIAEIMGATPATAVDGRGLLPLLSDPDASLHDGIVLELLKGDEDNQFEAIRTLDRKYVRYPDGEEELYDEAADPYELENLAASPAWVAEKARLVEQLDRLIADSAAHRDATVTRAGRFP